MKTCISILGILLLIVLFGSCSGQQSRIEFSGYNAGDTIDYKDFNEKYSSNDSTFFNGVLKKDNKLEVFTFKKVITFLNYSPLTEQECLDYKICFEDIIGFKPELKRKLLGDDNPNSVRWFYWNDSLNEIHYSITIEDEYKDINPNSISIQYEPTEPIGNN